MKDRGIYNLKIRLDRLKAISVGRLGIFIFSPGYYIYTGRAKKNLLARLERHKRKKKKLYWHIDYFLRFGKIEDIKIYPWRAGGECLINKKIAKIKGARIRVPKFGSSDCICNSHLVYFTKDLSL